MLDLSDIQSRLQSEAPALQQVILPDLEDVRGPDSATELVTLLDADVTGESHPVLLPDDVTYPAAVYELTGSQRQTVDGYPIFRIDSYLVYFVHSVYGTLVALAKTVQGSLQDYSPSSAAGTVDIVDQDGSGYNPDMDLYEWAMQIEMTHLARTTQTLPAAYVYTTGESFLVGEEVTCVGGMAEARFSVLLVDKMPATGISGLSTTRTQILDALGAYSPSGWGKIEPQGGDVSAVRSKLVAWRDDFITYQERTYS